MQTQRNKSKNLSELDLLKQRVIDFETENIKLKANNAKLKQTLKEHKIRITNLEQRNKEKTVTNMQNNLSMKDVSYEINSNNTPEKIINTSNNALNSDNTQSKIVILEEFNINLVNDNLWLRNEIEKLKKDIDELKKELESKKNRKFQEKCILIAQVLIGEKPVVEYHPSFMEELELDTFF
ncbi:17150_t:CDS:1 [Gigaspora margarita]|uniref:17150_t:CDS:1 n=1 Tax=Gigaspora margarita TaxID=4874 RepID=A0ABN7VJJ9_GIGMA|nr:17150_t:CDS:1 [Gigaspora margarita]